MLARPILMSSAVNKFYCKIFYCTIHGKASKTMFKESDRLETFKNWPNDFLSKNDLARNGFYYTGKKDKVICVFCSVSVSDWKMEDNIKDKHKNLSEKCDLVEGRHCANIPLYYENNYDKTIKNEDAAAADGVDENGGECEAGGSRPYSKCHHKFKNEKWGFGLHPGLLEHLFDNPANQEFSQFESRLKSFKSWPKPYIQASEKLSEAGFYYTQKNDETCCFYCGLGLHEWVLNQDPWVEHAVYSGDCKFLNQQKGREFVLESFRKKKMFFGEYKPQNEEYEVWNSLLLNKQKDFYIFQ